MYYHYCKYSKKVIRNYLINLVCLKVYLLSIKLHLGSILLELKFHRRADNSALICIVSIILYIFIFLKISLKISKSEFYTVLLEDFMVIVWRKLLKTKTKNKKQSLNTHYGNNFCHYDANVHMHCLNNWKKLFDYS